MVNLYKILIVFLVALFASIAHIPFEDVNTKINYLIGISALFSLIAALNHRQWINNQGFLKLILLNVTFILCAFVHVRFFLPHNEYAYNKLFYLVFCISMFSIVVPSVFSRKDYAIYFCISMVIFSVIFMGLSFIRSTDTQNLRYSAIGLSPTMMGKIVLLSGLAFFSFNKVAKHYRIALLLLLIVSIFASVNTGSRGPFVVFVATMCLYFYMRHQVKGILAILLISPIFLVTAFVAIDFLPPEISDRFNLEALSLEEHSDEGDRYYLWQIAMEGITRNFWGHGLGNFSSISFIAAPHNIILETLYELGYILTFILMIYLFLPLTYIKSFIKSDNGALVFVALLYIYSLMLSLISGELTLTSILLYFSTAILWIEQGRKSLAERTVPSAQVFQQSIHNVGIRA